jgi:hypothetical protein
VVQAAFLAGGHLRVGQIAHSPARLDALRHQHLRSGHVVDGHRDQVDVDLVRDGLQVTYHLHQLLGSRVKHDDQPEAAVSQAAGERVAEVLGVDRVRLVSCLDDGQY